MQVRGRYLVIAWTTVFLTVAGVIVARDRQAWAVRARVDALDSRIKSLIGLRSALDASLASLASH